jgi:hypothetical protein
VAAVAVLAAALTGCGSASPARPAATTTVKQNAAASATGRLRDSAFRRCLAAHGAASSTHNARYRNALRACTRSVSPTPARGALAKPAYRAALEKFVACIRRHGVPLGAPNTSGRRPILSTRGVDIHTSTFRAALKTCRGALPHASY